MITKPHESASTRHKLLYEIFVNSPVFQNMTIKDEVVVKNLIPSYGDGRHKIDWYIQDLRIAIEIMGEQHRKPVKFGGISNDLARFRMVGIKNRDSQKMYALISNGYGYTEIWYDENLTEELLISKIGTAFDNEI